MDGTIKVSAKSQVAPINNETYEYISITLPKSLLEAANIRPEDRLSFTVEKNTIRLVYDPEGRVYRTGVVGVNAKNFAHQLNQNFSAELPYTLEGDALVITIPDDAFIIKRGFGVVTGAIAELTKGFGGIRAA